MQYYLSECITDFLLRKKTIRNEENDIYVYGVELIISSIINLLICLIISLLFEDFANGLVFFISFSSLRRFTGGFHSKSFLRCNIIFAVIVVIALSINRYLSDVFDYAVFSVLLTVFTLLIIVLFSPVYNDNKKLTEQERKQFLLKSVLAYLIHILIYYLFLIFGIKLNIIIISDFIVAGMIVGGVFNNRLMYRN